MFLIFIISKELYIVSRYYKDIFSAHYSLLQKKEMNTCELKVQFPER